MTKTALCFSSVRQITPVISVSTTPLDTEHAPFVVCADSSAAMYEYIWRTHALFLLSLHKRRKT